MELSKKQLLTIHFLLFDYNVQMIHFAGQANPQTEEEMEAIERLIQIMNAGQVLFMEYAEYIIDKSGEMSESLQALIGGLAHKTLKSYNKLYEDLVRDGEKVGDEYYERKEIIVGLCKMFPSPEEVEEKATILAPDGSVAN